MRIAITGATGFLGSRLDRALSAEGHEIVRVVRSVRPGMQGVVEWDPAAGRIDRGGLEGIDVAIHLAGEDIVGWWTAAKKQRIRESRLRGTALLSETLAKLKRPPSALLSASGVNYYGAHEPGDPVDEDSPAGRGFLPDVCRVWEGATSSAAEAGIRVVHMRFGVVLGRGGALGIMLPLFKIGLGGSIGSGRQMVSWIAVDEIAPAIAHVLATDALRGAVNFTAPRAVPFSELARSLARALGRPALFRVPGYAVRLALGPMAEEMLLTGAEVVPKRLLESGYSFRYAELDAAMGRALGDGSGPDEAARGAA